MSDQRTLYRIGAEPDDKRPFLTDHWIHDRDDKEVGWLEPVEPTDLLTQLEAAPVIVNPDGDGGYIVTPIEDDVLLAVATEMSDANNWLPTERDNLYEALCDAISRIGEPA